MSGFELPGLRSWVGPAVPQMRVLGQGGPAPGLLGGTRSLPAGAEAPAGGDRPAATSAFGQSLDSALGQVAALQNDVSHKAQSLAMGEPVELQDLMLSMGKSEVAFNLMIEVRNKLTDAWDKLSRAVV